MNSVLIKCIILLFCRRISEEQLLHDYEDLPRKQAEAMKRLKEQQAAAAAGTSKPSLKSVTTIAAVEPSTMQTVLKVQKTNTLPNALCGNQLSKSQSGEMTSEKKIGKVMPIDSHMSSQPAVANKQIGKSKSTSSVPTPNQKTTITTTDTDKKVKSESWRNVHAH